MHSQPVFFCGGDFFLIFPVAVWGLSDDWIGPMTMANIFPSALAFGAGALLTLLVLAIIVSSCTPKNQTAAIVATFREELARAGESGPAAGSAAEREAVDRFGNFLQNIGSKDFIRENTAKTYTDTAFLNDTLVTHRGAAAIEAYFLRTADAMTHFEVTIDDVARSGADHYIRWTMVFAAPALSKGEKVHSTGISHVRFSADGRVAFHQDFWDSGENFFGRAPVAGGIIGLIRKRLESE